MLLDLIQEAHDGRFSGHFAYTNSFVEGIGGHARMRADVRKYCRSCLVCASRRGIGVTLTDQLPVGGPFHRVGVDVLQLPLLLTGISMRWFS